MSALLGFEPYLKKMEEALARHWRKNGEGITCLLCPRHCSIPTGAKGACGVRVSKEGKLYTRVYETVSTLYVDPIEKKPLYHFLPGSDVLSFGTVGCNLFCKHCQNADIAQTFTTYGQPVRIQSLLEHPCNIIAATYNEPTIFYEFMYDTFVQAKKRGKKTVMVSNGFIEEKPLLDLVHFLDAANIDLKGSDAFYTSQCSGQIDPIQRTITILHAAGVWLEVAFLLIPTLNDTQRDMKQLFSWIAQVDVNIPLHITAFYPRHKTRTLPPTSLPQLQRAHALAQSCGLHYVYIGNIANEYMHTHCPSCAKTIIQRKQGHIKNYMYNGVCPFCQENIPGVWT